MSKTINATGKRKRAVARASVSAGDGKIIINKRPLLTYEPEAYRLRIIEPIIIAGEAAKKIDFRVTVTGGGAQGQAEAARLAIAKGLVAFTGSKTLKKEFLSYDRHLMIADVRRNEPHKPNDSKPRAMRQPSNR